MDTFTEMESLMKKLNLCEKSAVSLTPVEEEYILHLDIQQSSKSPSTGSDDLLLASSSSNYSIRLFSMPNMVTLNQINAHNSVISGIKFANTEKNLLFSSSWDKSIRCWDTRTKSHKPVQEFTGSSKNLLCLDINSSDSKLAAGTEAYDSDSKEVDLIIWDRRKSSILTTYTESHEDDITQVSFHPQSEDVLASGSTDGLVCKFDLAQPTEDDALILTLNSLSSVAFVGWCDTSYKHIYCTTHIDTFHVWDAEEGDVVFQVTDLKEKLDDKIQYIVDYVGSTDSDHWIVLCGTHEGDLSILQLSNNYEEKLLSTLCKGHKATVRCVKWDDQNKTLLTGGEDSMICLWSSKPRSISQELKTSNKLKMKKTMKKFQPY